MGGGAGVLAACVDGMGRGHVFEVSAAVTFGYGRCVIFNGARQKEEAMTPHGMGQAAFSDAAAVALLVVRMRAKCLCR